VIKILGSYTSFNITSEAFSFKSNLCICYTWPQHLWWKLVKTHNSLKLGQFRRCFRFVCVYSLVEPDWVIRSLIDQSAQFDTFRWIYNEQTRHHPADTTRHHQTPPDTTSNKTYTTEINTRWLCPIDDSQGSLSQIITSSSSCVYTE